MLFRACVLNIQPLRRFSEFRSPCKPANFALSAHSLSPRVFKLIVVVHFARVPSCLCLFPILPLPLMPKWPPKRGPPGSKEHTANCPNENGASGWANSNCLLWRVFLLPFCTLSIHTHTHTRHRLRWQHFHSCSMGFRCRCWCNMCKTTASATPPGAHNYARTRCIKSGCNAACFVRWKGGAVVAWIMGTHTNTHTQGSTTCQKLGV